VSYLRLPVSSALFLTSHSLPFIGLYWCHVENVPTTAPRPKGPSVASNYLQHYSSSLVEVKLTLAGSVGIPEGHPIIPPTIKYTLDPATYRPVQLPSDSNADRMSVEPSDVTLRMTTALGSPLTLSASTSASTGGSSSSVPSISTTTQLNIASVFGSGAVELVDPLPPFLAQGLDGRGFKDLPRAAALLPISTNSGQGRTGEHGRTLPHAVLLVGLNTRRAYDADYAAWLESVCAGLSNQLTVVLQREADAKMIEERERMDKAKTMFFTNVSHGEVSSF
jgi:hypothetical protein